MSGRRIIFAKQFVREYHALPIAIQQAVDRAIEMLDSNPRHPSIQAKKMRPPSKGIFEARVTLNYRITYKIDGDTIILRRVGTHDILRTP